MKNICIIRILLLIILACCACAAAAQAQNYTAIVSFGQTPYQLGYLSKGNATGWTWWDTGDTDGGMQQKNLILLGIMMENATPVSGLSPSTWIQDSSTNSSGTYSWKAGRDIQRWHYLVELQEYTQEEGFLIRIIDWLINLFTGKSPPPEGFNLTFKTLYNMTESHGFVKVSVDRGEWVTLAEYSGNSTGWVERTVNLTDYSGKKILIAFHFISNDNNDVWWIDDIEVKSNGATLFSDGAEAPDLPPRLTVNVSYPGYDYSSDTFSVKNTTVELVEDHVHQLYYGVFFYPDDAYTGKYTVNFSNRINSTDVSASTGFNTTLWGCQRRGCHDSSSSQSDPLIQKPTVMIHPDNI
ncbi:MAG: hypothetical protein Q8O41_01595, partial [Candidatus Methanoperedens sp.]|nr:hypothetical protein [Candidatus Methanoperedens sp.]